MKSATLAIYPSLLPARSWKVMMQEQASRFEENLSLEQNTVKKIEAFLVGNAVIHLPDDAEVTVTGE